MRMLPQRGKGDEVHFRYPTPEDIRRMYELKTPIVLTGFGYATMKHEEKEFIKVVQLIY
jgi:hypothetical protein